MSWQHFVRRDGAPLRQFPLESTTSGPVSSEEEEEEVHYNIPDIGMCEMPISHRFGVIDIYHFTHNFIFHQELMKKHIMWRVPQHMADREQHRRPGRDRSLHSPTVCQGDSQRLLAQDVKIQRA